MKLKQFDMTTKILSLEFEKEEFTKFNTLGNYLVANEDDQTETFKLVKRGKTETTNYILIDNKQRRFLSKSQGILKGQFLKNKNKTFLVIELGKTKK